MFIGKKFVQTVKAFYCWLARVRSTMMEGSCSLMEVEEEVSDFKC